MFAGPAASYLHMGNWAKTKEKKRKGKDREYIFNNDILEITDAPLIKQKVANGYTQI